MGAAGRFKARTRPSHEPRAAPAYLERHGLPTHPSELRGKHRVVAYFSAGSGRFRPFDFAHDGERLEIQGRYVVAVNDSNANLAAGLAGFGIMQVPAFMVAGHIARDEMVLEDWTSDSLPVYVVYPPSRRLSAKLRVFVDWTAEMFAEYG